MARPKGSKNKAKVLDGVDYAAQIAEKNTATKSLAEEIAALGSFRLPIMIPLRMRPYMISMRSTVPVWYLF